MINSLILGCLLLLVFVSDQHLVFCNFSPPRMFFPLDLLSKYPIQHGAIGPLYVTSNYSTWIFCRGVSGFATDCPCGVWCLPPACWFTFWKSTFKQQLDCRFGIMDSISYFFCILTYAIVYVLIHHIIFRLYLYFFNNILYFYQVLLY